MASKLAVRRGVTATVGEPIDFGWAMAHWLEYLQRDYSPDTVHTYRWAAVQFGKWMDERGLDFGSIEEEHVRSYRQWMVGKRRSVGTMRLHLAALRAMFDWIHTVRPDLFLVNPIGKLRGLKASSEHKRVPLTNEEVRRLLARTDGSHLGIRDRAILHLMAYCGLRAIEVRRAKRGDIRRRGDRNTLSVQGKGRKEADSFVVIPDPAWGALGEWLEIGHQVYLPERPLFYSLGRRVRGKELGPRTVLAIVKGRMREAGIDDPCKTTHSLRHTAITNALLHDASPLQVQQMARHGSFDTTLIYVHEILRMQNPAEDLINYRDAEEEDVPQYQYVYVRR